MRWTLVLALIFVSACTKKNAGAEKPYETVGVADSEDDISIPTELWKTLKPENINAEKGKEKKDDVEFSLTTLDVTLEEKNPGVLKKPNYLIRFARGGGTIDLADYLSGETGTFFVKMKAPEMQDDAVQEVYFVSRAKKRKVTDEVVGAGCNSYFNISKKFIGEMKRNGIEVNTSDMRHANVIGGTFLIKYSIEKKFYLTQVTFLDSRIPEVQCKPGDAGKEKSNDDHHTH